MDKESRKSVGGGTSNLVGLLLVVGGRCSM